MTAKLHLRPITVTKALAFNASTHRRLPKLQGGMWACAVKTTDVLGVAIVGRPTARILDNGSRLQVLRCAVIEGTPNACSMLYGACGRAAKAIGASDCFTYTHDDESGISLKAAGWVEDPSFQSKGGQWSRPSRERGETVEPGAKRRWWAPWSEYLKQFSATPQEAA